jgi:ubiquinone/menaquinone biosynthesis C-methylase UbiE
LLEASIDSRDHWERIYRETRGDELSWFQPRAEVSEALIREAVLDRQAPILDVGGGASTLADDLVAEGYGRVTVLDLASSALTQAQSRLGTAARQVGWVVGDVLTAPLARASIDLWHDRAVFHFLVDPVERERYVAEVRRIVRPGGLVLVAAFALDAPSRCSGLPVSRYDAESLHTALDGGFQLLRSRREVHHTPSGASQPFTYCLCRYVPSASSPDAT